MGQAGSMHGKDEESIKHLVRKYEGKRVLET
jgi:hypothetical protein